MVKNSREDSPDPAAGSPRPDPQTGAPPDQGRALEPVTCKRRVARQATSSVAYTAPPPAEDDPLLAFAPYRHTAPRGNSITPARQRAFIAHLAATGVVASAAMHIGKSMEALYKLRQRPGAEGFAAAWDAAVERGVQRIEENALARAMQGTPEWKVMPDGGLITYGSKYNEALVMFFLRNRRPERYSEHIRPGHPVYERIRGEVLAALRPTGGGGRQAGAGAGDAGEADSRECTLSRHFADRLAREGEAAPAALPEQIGDEPG